MNKIKLIFKSQQRSYRLGRRILPSGYYLSPTYFDQKLSNKLLENNIVGLNGRIKYQNELFDNEQQRQKSLITRYEKIEVKLEPPFPDGNDYVLMMNANLSTPYDCANHINEYLKERSALAMVNDNEYWDMHRPLQQSCKQLRFLHFKHDDCMPVNYAFWRSCSMLLASVLKQKVFGDEYYINILSKPMSDLNGGSFICDIEIENLRNNEWTPNQQEIQSITSLLWDETLKNNHRFERLQISSELAKKLFQYNSYRLNELNQLINEQQNSQFIIYRLGNYIELTDGPMISNLKQIGSIYLSAIYPLKNKNNNDENKSMYRFQGIALPKQLNINPFAFSLIRNRSKMFNSYGFE